MRVNERHLPLTQALPKGKREEQGFDVAALKGETGVIPLRWRVGVVLENCL